MSMTGRLIGNYRVIDKLGEGAMGVVYRAVDLMVEREVAMKSLKVDAKPETLDRFRSEAVALARLNHPSIAQLYTFFRDGNECYMVMEYVAGETLEDRLSRGGAMGWPEAVHLTRLILDGLQHAHAQGILHRDIKPANIMLPTAGGVKITDFGIAQMMGSARMTTEGRLVGTLEYLAPERIQGDQAVPASDLYSVGVLLYEMLTAKLPFTAPTEYELLIAQVRQPPTPPAQHGVSLPTALEAVLMKALDKQPARRYPDAPMFSAALTEAFMAAPPATAAGLVPAAAASAMRPDALWNWISPLFTGQRKYAAAGVLAGLALFGAAFAVREFGVKPADDPWKPTPPAGPSEPANQPLTPAAGGGAGGTAVPDLPTTPIPYRPPQPEAPGQTAPPNPVGVPPPAAPAPTTTTPAQPARPTPDRRAVMEALNQTDGAQVSGAPGSHAIHAAGLTAAVRLGAPSLLGEIVEAVKRRGVNFQITPAIGAALKSAGANQALLDAVAASYRAPELPAVSVTVPPPVAAPPPPPVSPAPATPLAPSPEPSRHVQTLRDVRTIFVSKLPDGMDEMIATEIAAKLGPRVKVTKSAGAADGVLRVDLEEKAGALSRAGRVFGMDKIKANAVLTDRSGRMVLWQREVGDKNAQRVAARLAKELSDEFR